MSCISTCVRPSPSQAHCAAGNCHRTFGSVSAFDRHRRGGECLHPEEVGLQERNGVWRAPLDERQRARLAALKPDAQSASRCTPQTAETGPGVPICGNQNPHPAHERDNQPGAGGIQPYRGPGTQFCEPCAMGNSCPAHNTAPRHYAEHPPVNRPHPTCIDVTGTDQTPRSEWACGPECPKEA